MIFSGLHVQNVNIKIIMHTLHRVYCHDRVKKYKNLPTFKFKVFMLDTYIKGIKYIIDMHHINHELTL